MLSSCMYGVLSTLYILGFNAARKPHTNWFAMVSYVKMHIHMSSPLSLPNFCIRCEHVLCCPSANYCGFHESFARWRILSRLGRRYIDPQIVTTLSPPCRAHCVAGHNMVHTHSSFKGCSKYCVNQIYSLKQKWLVALTLILGSALRGAPGLAVICILYDT